MRVGRFLACAVGRTGVEQGRRRTNRRLLMSTPILDPSLPADNSPLSSGEMRGQFSGLVEGWPVLRSSTAEGGGLRVERAAVSNPPTQADVQALADKLDELINILSA